MNIKKLLTFIFALIVISCNATTENDNVKYDDILNIKNIPDSVKDWKPLFFADKGSWLGYALPTEQSNTIGSFTGPFLISEGKWLSKSLIKINLDNEKVTKNVIKFKPGYLFQKLETSGFNLEAKLFYASNDLIVINYNFSNDKIKKHSFSLNTFEYTVSKLKDIFVINTNADSIFISTITDEKFLLKKNEIVVTSDNKDYSVSFLIGFNNKSKYDKKAIQTLFEKNIKTWQNYITKIESKKSKKKKFDLAAYKSLVTLIINWRSAYKDIKHQGVFPSSNISYFNGFWAWDSWKHAVALAYFEPEVAKDQIRAMFDYQNEKGMVADCIYQNKEENNWLNTKPPLSAWAVWNVYKNTNDIQFLKELYPKLRKYHYWWYKFRDANNNNFCEYGGTANKLVAAKWESGMDNAVRFDDSKMSKNKSGEFSIDQESVDLNAYLIFEKQLLLEIARKINNESDVVKYENEINILNKTFNKYFYNPELKTFTDRRIKDGFINSVGPESWTPLFTGIADTSIAKSTARYMLDKNYFNSFVPLPTLDVNNPKFSNNGYWRGPVWLDQVYFGIIGLLNYGYREEANNLTEKLLNNCEGLLEKGITIRENYNPLNGKGLEARNFSWSAAHILMLYFNDSID